MTAPSFHTPGIIVASRPTVILGGTAGRFGSTRAALATASRGAFHAIDLDLRTTWLPPSWTRITSVADREIIRVRSVWLPEFLHGFAEEPRAHRLEEFLRHGQGELGLRELIVPRLQADGTNGFNVSRHARDFAKRSHGVVRLVIGIRAESLIRSANHLDRIVSIRRAVEEWDLDVALDLTGTISPRWESEAAIAKVLPRLTVVRIESWLNADGTADTTPRGQLAARTIAMLSDQKYTGIISLYPVPSSLLIRPTVASMASMAELLYRDIQNRYARTNSMPVQGIPAPYPHPSVDRP